jgi:hypothetical protein
MKLQPINKKAPITAEIIQKMVEKHTHLQADLKGLRIACICSLGFSGFFRYSELANISASHIQYEHDHVRIFIPSAKNDIYREGNYVYMKKLGNEYCPVDVLRRYTEVTNAYSEPNLPIFTPLRFFRSSNLFKLYVLITYIYTNNICTSNLFKYIYFHTQDAKKYSKNVYKNLDMMKRNMDYTV